MIGKVPGKQKVSKVDMVLKFLDKDLRTIKSIDSHEVQLSDVESMLLQALEKVKRFNSF